MIVGQRVSLNPLVTLLAIFIGGQIWGLAGMILFIPALAMLKEVCDEVDSLRPYGYLLGKVKTREETEKEYFSGKFRGFRKADGDDDRKDDDRKDGAREDGSGNQ